MVFARPRSRRWELEKANEKIAVKYPVRKLVLTVARSLVGQTEWWNGRAHGERSLCHGGFSECESIIRWVRLTSPRRLLNQLRLVLVKS